eukprot:3777714-Amphidinium_carterae.1
MCAEELDSHWASQEHILALVATSRGELKAVAAHHPQEHCTIRSTRQSGPHRVMAALRIAAVSVAAELD